MTTPAIPSHAELTLPAPAKLNLMLHILGRRADGYHLLQTLFQFLDYGDELGFALRQDGEIRLHTEVPGVPHDSNLIVRAARRLQEASATGLGADIWLDKRLPMAAASAAAARMPPLPCSASTTCGRPTWVKSAWPS